MGTIHYFLGLQFDKVNQGMAIHQQKYIKELLHSYSIVDVPSVSTPLPHNIKFTTTEKLTDPTSYRQLVGKLNFLLHTRPDLSFAVQFLSHHNQSPTIEHYSAALHVLRYLKGTLSQSLLFNSSSHYALEVYCDFD